MMRLLLASGVLATLPAIPAATIGPITIELPSITVSGSAGVPLGRAAGGGYQSVLTQISISATATGVATLTAEGGAETIVQGTLLPVEISLTGSATVTFTDIDNTYNYFGLPSTFERTVSFSSRAEGGNCSADLTRPNYGCFPPLGSTLMGLSEFRVDLPVDIDGNGLVDKLVIQPASSNVDQILSAIRRLSTVTTTFTLNSALNGAVLDQANDSPFSLPLSGVGTGVQTVVAEPLLIPEPATYWLCGTAIAGLSLLPRRRSS